MRVAIIVVVMLISFGCGSSQVASEFMSVKIFADGLCGARASIGQASNNTLIMATTENGKEFIVHIAPAEAKRLNEWCRDERRKSKERQEKFIIGE